MEDFKIPTVPKTEQKGVRFPIDMIEEIENEIRGTDATFSSFVIGAARWALDNLKEQRARKS